MCYRRLFGGDGEVFSHWPSRAVLVKEKQIPFRFNLVLHNLPLIPKGHESINRKYMYSMYSIQLRLHCPCYVVITHLISNMTTRNSIVKLNPNPNPLTP